MKDDDKAWERIQLWLTRAAGGATEDVLREWGDVAAERIQTASGAELRYALMIVGAVRAELKRRAEG